MSRKATPSEIHELLQENNPFERGLVVRDQNIWGVSFPDIPGLNKHASDAIFDTLKRLKKAKSSLDKISSIVIRAERGAGKTHIINRIRKKILIDRSAVLIYASADKYSELDLIASSFQQSVAESLDQLGNTSLSQWQEIAAQIVAAALKANNPKATVPSPEVLASKFDQAYEDSVQKGRDLVTDLAKVVRRLNSNADLYIIRAILWTLSETRGALAVKWLAGESLNAEDALDLRLSANEGREVQEREAQALRHTSKILSFIAEYRSTVICFDELDTFNFNELGLPTPHAVADLIKRLFDSLVQSENSQGILITTVLLPNVWQLFKEQSSGGESSNLSLARISTRKEPIDLGVLNPELMIELISLWMSSFYERKQILFDNLLYPFSAEELSVYAKNRPTVREALSYCAKQLPIKLKELDVEPVKPSTPKQRFESAYQKALANDWDEDDLGNNDFIARILRFSFEKIIHLLAQGKLKEELIENVKLKAVEDIAPKSKNNGYLNFKIIGEENGESVTIGVEVLQQKNGLSVGAGFRRLLDYDTFEISRGCLVRSMERKIKRSWDSHEYYQQLIQQGGEWVHLKEAELKPLAALQHIYNNHETHDLSISRLDSFAFTRNTLVDNPLIQEILSRPVGVLIEDALEGKAIQHLHSKQEVDDIANNLNETLENLDQEEEKAKANIDLADLEVV